MKNKILLSIAVFVIILSTLACTINLPDILSNPTPTLAPTLTPPVVRNASLTVNNDTTTSIFYLYIALSSDPAWGEDQLGSTTIPAGGSYTFSDLAPGTYDIKAEDSSHNVMETLYSFTINRDETWTVTTSGSGGTASLTVYNNTSTSIFYLYISPSSSSWGDDQLGSSTIPAGGSYTFSNLTPGVYDLKAEDSNHNVMETLFSFSIYGDEVWYVTTSGGGGATASLTVYNNTSTSIFYLYISPSSSSWGEDRLGSSTIPAGGSFTYSGLTPGIYDLKAEDSSHNVMQTLFSFSINGAETWSVTTSGGGAGTASLTVYNNTSTTIFYMYFSPSSSPWGEDQLGSSTIPAGGSYTFSGLTPGIYDLKAEDSGHNVMQTLFSFSINGAATWSVTTSGGGATTASLTVYNNTTTSIWYVYISPSTSSSWGDDQLGSSTIPAGGSYTFSGLTPGSYDIKAEDSSHNVLKTTFDVYLSGAYNWYVP